MNGLNENFVKTALIVASFAIAGFLALYVNPAWLFLLLVPLFGIPLLRELHVLRDADERETWDHYRGSHLAFYAIMIYIVLTIINSWLHNVPLPYELSSILMIAVVVKLLFGVATVLDQRLAAVLLMGLYGIIWLFVSVPAGHGFAEIAFYSAGGIAVLLIAAIGWFLPLPGGVLMAMLSAVFLFYPFNIFLFRTPLEGHLMVVTMIVVPPLAAGWMLINSYLRDRRSSPEGDAREALS